MRSQDQTNAADSAPLQAVVMAHPQLLTHAEWLMRYSAHLRKRAGISEALSHYLARVAFEDWTAEDDFLLTDAAELTPEQCADEELTYWVP